MPRIRPLRPPGSQWADILRYYHAMRPEQWHAMFREQRGCCYLCERPLSADRKKIAIDHDHDCCPKLRSCRYCRRGLACRGCNSGIGMFDEDPEVMRRAAANLEKALAATRVLMVTKPEQGQLLDSP